MLPAKEIGRFFYAEMQKTEDRSQQGHRVLSVGLPLSTPTPHHETRATSTDHRPMKEPVPAAGAAQTARQNAASIRPSLRRMKTLQRSEQLEMRVVTVEKHVTRYRLGPG